MRKLEREIIGLSVLAGLFFWITDAVLDYHLKFHDTSFWRIFFFDAPTHALIIRPSVVLIFLILGIISAKVVTKGRLAEERCHQLFESMRDWIFVFPVNARGWQAGFTEVNAAASRDLGYSREELEGLSLGKLAAPGQLPEMPGLWARLKAEGHLLFETVLISKGGAQKPVEINAHVVSFEDKPQVLALARDISARKQREAEIHRLASFPQLNPNPILEVDTAGRVTYFNIAVQETLKRLGGKEAEVFLPDDLPEIIRAAQAGAEKQFLREKEINGAVFEEFIHFTPAYDVLRLYPADVTERRRAEQALRDSEQQLRTLTAKLLHIQETERRRISIELHDELGQALIYLKLQMGAARARMRKDQGALKKDCDYLLHYLDGIIENVRRLSWDLSPTVLEDMGLSAALKYWLEEFGKYYKVQNLSVDIEEIDDLFSPKVQLNIYRIFQECLTNIGRHAQATQISLAIRKNDGNVSFSVKDNGQGFEVETALSRESSTKGIGLATMAERVRLVGGTLQIDSRKGEGTEITFAIPADARRKEHEGR